MTTRQMNSFLIAVLTLTATIGFAKEQFPKMECPSSLTVKVSKIEDAEISSYGLASNYDDLTNVLKVAQILGLKSNQANATFLELGGCGYDNGTSTAKPTVAANINKLGIITIWLPTEKVVVDENSFDPRPNFHFVRIYSTPFDTRARVGSALSGCFYGQYECANPFSHNSDGQDWLYISSYEVSAKYISGHAPILIKSK